MGRFPGWLKWLAGGVAALVVLSLVAIAVVPVGPFKGVVESRLSARFGRPVTIGRLDREQLFSLNPTIVVRDVHVPQAAWAGDGTLARIAEVRATISAFPLLVGRVTPRDLSASGVRLDLVRDAAGRENWNGDDDGKSGGGSSPLEGLTLRDTIVRYRDFKQDRSFTLRLDADARGVRVAGRGLVRGEPVTVTANAPAIVAGEGGEWPFRAAIDGRALSMSAEGRMRRPLDLGHMRLSMTARADDLKLIDTIIEAGLIRTQPVRLSAKVERDAPRWIVTDLAGTIGTSAIAGRVTVDKIDGRTRLDGNLRSARLDFDDLADDAGQAAALALERREGLKLVPNTRVNLAKIGKTDGRITVRIDRLFSKRRPGSLTSLGGVVTLDHQKLTAEDLRIGLKAGAITGRAVVDQSDGAAVPLVTLALDLRNSRLSALAGNGGPVDARVDGRVRLAGRGSTIRAAVGASDGTIGIVARDGSLPAKMAELLGFDVGASLLADKDQRATLRCAVARLDMKGGRGTFAPLVVDTSRSQTRGTGTVTFPAETIAATLSGAPKGGSMLRLPVSIPASGTLRDPKVVVPREAKSARSIFKAIGRAITGHQGPTATDADCAALARRALGG